MAGLGPQVVQVLDFATARAPELQALHELAHHARMHSTVDDKLSTQRNQRRRRANAFKSHQMPRRLRLQGNTVVEPQEEEHIALGNGRGRHLEMVTAPPVVMGAMDKARAKRDQRPRCRKHRRRMHLLLEDHAWLQNKSSEQNEEQEQDGDSTSLETPKWLATHAWHAKRMKMGERYGHVLAQRRQDKSVSAALAALRTSATLHDASYYGVLELYGSAQLIVEALQLVADPSGSDFDEIALLSGQQEGRSVLYHSGQFPMGAIAPVTFMWRPLQADYAVGSGEFTLDAAGEDETFPTTKRQLWLWIHPAAYMEAASAIAGACQEAMAEHDAEESIEILDRRGHVARLQIRGKRADTMLDDVLNKLTTPSLSEDEKDSDASHADGFTNAAIQKLAAAVNLDILKLQLRQREKKPEPHIHSVLVRDPRVRSNKPRDDVPASTGGGGLLSLLEEPDAALVDPMADILCPLSGTSVRSSDDAEEPDSALLLARLEALLKWTSSSTPTADAAMASSVLTYPYVPPTGASATTTAAATAAAITPLANHDTKTEDDDIEMADDKPTTSVPCSLLWSVSGRDRVRRTFRKDHEVNAAKPHTLQREGTPVPLLLVRKQSSFADASGWDVVLSPVYAAAFLNALVFRGAMAIGLNEHEALSTVDHEACFPRDFPDTEAGRVYWQLVAQAKEDEYVKKPKAKRVAYGKLGVESPFRPNWESLFGANLAACDENEQPDADEMVVDESTEAVDDGEHADEADEDDGESDEDDIDPSTSLCVLRGASYMAPFPFPASQLDEQEKKELIPVAHPTLIRVALSFPRRGNLEPCSMLYVPTEDDISNFFADPKWSGRQWGDAPANADEELELLGFVTSAVYDRPKGAFRGTAFCACEQLQRLALTLQQNQQKQGDTTHTRRPLVALTRTPASRQLRPVVLHIQEDA